MKMYKFSILLAAAVLLASCNKETAGGADEGIPMWIEASIAGETKSSLTTESLTDFSLLITCGDPLFSYSGQVTKSGGKWSASSPLFWKDETTSVTYGAARFGSHAFTEAEFTDGVSLSVPVDQSTQAGLDAADLVFKSFSSVTYGEVESGVLSFPFKHQLSKVNIILTLGPRFYGNGYGQSTNPVTDLTLKGSNTGFTFNPSATAGWVSVVSGTQADIVPLTGSYTPGTTDAKSSTANYEAVLVPQELAAGTLTLSFKVGGVQYQWSNPGALSLAAGQSYVLELAATDAPLPSNP